MSNLSFDPTITHPINIHINNTYQILLTSFELMTILSIFQDIEVDTCKQLSNNLQKQQWEDLIQLSLVYDQIQGDINDNCIINIIDKPYDYHDDL